MRGSRVHSWDILQISAAWRGTQLILRVSGELDLCSAPYLRQALDEAAAQTPARVLLDLEGVSFIDVAGIRAILDGAKIFESRLVLHRTPPYVMRLFTLIGVEQQLTFGPD